MAFNIVPLLPLTAISRNKTYKVKTKGAHQEHFTLAKNGILLKLIY